MRSIDYWPFIKMCFVTVESFRKSWKDVLMQSIQFNDCSYMKERKEKNNSLYKGHKLFLSEDWYEVVRVDCGVISIFFSRIDVPLSSKSIWFGAKITRMKSDDKIELREVLEPPYLPLGQYLGSRKILKVFMICNFLLHTINYQISGGQLVGLQMFSSSKYLQF